MFIYIEELKIQGLKRTIEKTRKKLNSLLEQDEAKITDEILDTSHKLDILINNYYNMQTEDK
ncbi:hypothetical protein OXPF_10130 [Oxobacter pfennigii]|uniref:Spo0E like sporulation regulatory protein n=1 Tax=Oxobacter pfennigii TaxID=36849 RepID=A0A0P8WDD5_9CLOT|nr:aspartyl-phosphate phosphatase Spo0E family protein [Oxobacter pfennigii]KPU45778.1 hypothetical protein OXPF_10130 [Oxobacter pfennigii]